MFDLHARTAPGADLLSTDGASGRAVTAPGLAGKAAALHELVWYYAASLTYAWGFVWFARLPAL